MDYTELFEILRKEKYSEQLQTLPKSFLNDLSKYLSEQKKKIKDSGDFFSDEIMREKKQFENSISIFRELMLRRKKKILSLVFVASETGIMKRDFGTMLEFEQELFEKIVRVVEEGDRKFNDILYGRSEEIKSDYKMVIAKEDIGEFVSLDGKVLGPFVRGELLNLDSQVVEILASDGKVKSIDGG